MRLLFLLLLPVASAAQGLEPTRMADALTLDYFKKTTQHPKQANALARIVASDLADLNRADLTGLLTRLLHQIEKHPSTYLAGEILLDSLSAELQSELNDQAESIWEKTSDSTILALEVGFVLLALRGGWRAFRTRGDLNRGRRFARMRHGLSAVKKSLGGWKTVFVTGGIGAGAGLIQTLYTRLRTQIEDPYLRLLELRQRIIDHATRIMRNAAQRLKKPLTIQQLEALEAEVFTAAAQARVVALQAPEYEVDLSVIRKAALKIDEEILDKIDRLLEDESQKNGHHRKAIIK